MSSGPGISGLRRIRLLQGAKDQNSTKNDGKKGNKTSVPNDKISKGPPGFKRCYGVAANTTTMPCSLDENEVSIGHIPEKQLHASSSRSTTRRTTSTFTESEVPISKKPKAHAATTSEASSPKRTKAPAATVTKAPAPKKNKKITEAPALTSATTTTITKSPTPAHKINVAPSETTTKIDAPPKYKKTARGVARGESSEKFVEKHGKFKISYLPGEAVAVNNDEQFGSAIGLIVRGHADIGKEFPTWDDVSDSSKDFCYARLGRLFDVEDSDTLRIQHINDQKFQRAYTSWRYILHIAYKSLKAKGISPRSVSPRKDIDLEKWQLACDFIEDSKFQDRSKINVENRGKMLFNQTTGRTPFLTRFKKMNDKSRIEFFKLTRVSKKKGGGFVNSVAEAKYDEMIEMRNRVVENDGEPMSESEIVKAALGHKSGYVKGMGHGLQLSRGMSSSMTVGIDINKKLSELDSAKEEISRLNTESEEQKSTMNFMKTQFLKWQKIMEKLPEGSQLLTDGALDEAGET